MSKIIASVILALIGTAGFTLSDSTALEIAKKEGLLQGVK